MPTFSDDVVLEIDLLRTADYNQAVIVDLTKPEFGIPVVRAVVPGMLAEEHA